MTRTEFEELVHEGLREFHIKQGVEVTESLNVVLRYQAEFLAVMVAAKQKKKGGRQCDFIG